MTTGKLSAQQVQTFLKQSEAEQADQLRGLSDQQFKSFSKAINRIRNQEFERGSHRPEYSNLRRSFYEDELKEFLDAAPHYGIKAAYLTMLFYALRAGELQHLEYAEDQQLLKIYNEKVSRTEYIPVHGQTTRLLKYLHEYQDYATSYLRKRFGDMRDQSGLDYQYGTSKTGRPLYQFSTHSLRKTAITMFAKQITSQMKVKSFARHKDGDTTMRYFDYDYRTWRNDLKQTFTSLYKLI